MSLEFCVSDSPATITALQGMGFPIFGSRPALILLLAVEELGDNVAERKERPTTAISGSSC